MQFHPGSDVRLWHRKGGPAPHESKASSGTRFPTILRVLSSRLGLPTFAKCANSLLLASSLIFLAAIPAESLAIRKLILNGPIARLPTATHNTQSAGYAVHIH